MLRSYKAREFMSTRVGHIADTGSVDSWRLYNQLSQVTIVHSLRDTLLMRQHKYRSDRRAPGCLYSRSVGHFPGIFLSDIIPPDSLFFGTIFLLIYDTPRLLKRTFENWHSRTPGHNRFTSTILYTLTVHCQMTQLINN